MNNLKKIYNLFMSNIILRNTTALLLDLLYTYILFIVVSTIYTCSVKDLNIYLIVSYTISLIIVGLLSRRIRVTRICPKCFENRGIANNTFKTGKTKNYRQFVKGDYYWYEQDVECVEVVFCHYCQYEDSNLFWKKEQWQGDLTEEAKIRLAAEEHRKAEEKARINAYEEIRRRRRGY